MRWKFFVILLLGLCGVVGTIHASTLTPVYTKDGPNDGPNRLGFSFASNPSLGLVIDSTNHRLFVADTDNSRVLVYILNSSNSLIDRFPDYVLGQSNFSTDTATTTQSGMNKPAGLAYDSAGNRLFVSDFGNNRVLVFDVTSITNGEDAVSVLGQADFTTATAATTQAGMNNPYGLAYDSANNRLFVAHTLANRVTVFDVTSITNGEDAVSVLGQADFTTATAATTQAGMNNPYGLAYDSANNRLFVAQRLAKRVTVFDVASITNGEDAVNVLGQANFTSSTSATTQAGLSILYSVEYDATNSRLFVGDRANNRVMIFDVTSITNGEDAVSVLGQADFTTATAATTQAGMNGPWGMAYDSANSRLYVVQADSSRISIFDVDLLVNGEDAVDLLGQYDDSTTNPQPVYTKSGLNNGPNRYGLSGSNNSIIDAVNHRLFVTDSGNNRVFVYELTSGNLLVDRIPDYVLGQSNFYTREAATTQSGLRAPSGLTYDSANNRLFVGDNSNNRVLVFDVTSITNGEDAVSVLGQADFTTATAATTQAGMKTPTGVAYDSANTRLFVSQGDSRRVLVYDVASITNGEDAVSVLGQANFTSATLAVTQSGMSRPSAVAYDSAGSRLFVADSSSSNRVLVFDVTSITNGEDAVSVLGQADFTSGTAATTQSGLRAPSGLTYDSANNRLFVGDNSNNRVLVFDVTSITNGEDAVSVLGQADFTTATAIATQSGLMGPAGMGYESTNQYLYVMDGTSNRIAIFDASGITDGENMIDLIGQYDDSLWDIAIDSLTSTTSASSDTGSGSSGGGGGDSGVVVEELSRLDQGTVSKKTGQREIQVAAGTSFRLTTHPVDSDLVQKITIRITGKGVHELKPLSKAALQYGHTIEPLPVGRYLYALTVYYGFGTRTDYGVLIVRQKSTGVLTSDLIPRINYLFRLVHDRNPTYPEWEYWAERILSKSKETLDALYGAMQWQKMFGEQ